MKDIPKISYHSFDFKDEKVKLRLERHHGFKRLDISERQKIAKDINQLLLNSWGSFPEEFVNDHILNADKIFLAWVNDKCIGLASMNIKKVISQTIHYLEFVLVDKEYQREGLGTFLSFEIIKEEMLKNLIYILIGGSLNIFFITPNVRVLTLSEKFSNFIYPNPYLADENGKISEADEETWRLALKLLENSDNPNRKLEREGLVLHKSYANTPWLIYNNDNAPWHSDDKINTFAKRYLGYHKGEDREFVVRLKINLFSTFKYLLRN